MRGVLRLPALAHGLRGGGAAAGPVPCLGGGAPRGRAVTALAPAPAPRGGVATLAATTDHKRIAGLIAGTAGLFFLGGGLLALFMRSELAAPGMQFMGHDAYNQMFTIHGSAMIYLFMTPMALAAGVYLVPLQVGAAEMAGARWALGAYWAYALGGLMMFSGFLTDHGAARAGWFAYTPLSIAQYTPGAGQNLWTFSVLLAVGASIVWAACILGTVARRRAPGMTMLRLAPFTWAEVATVLMVLFA